MYAYLCYLGEKHFRGLQVDHKIWMALELGSRYWRKFDYSQKECQAVATPLIDVPSEVKILIVQNLLNDYIWPSPLFCTCKEWSQLSTYQYHYRPRHMTFKDIFSVTLRPRFLAAFKETVTDEDYNYRQINGICQFIAALSKLRLCDFSLTKLVVTKLCGCPRSDHVRTINGMWKVIGETWKANYIAPPDETANISPFLNDEQALSLFSTYPHILYLRGLPSIQEHELNEENMYSWFHLNVFQIFKQLLETKQKGMSFLFLDILEGRQITHSSKFNRHTIWSAPTLDHQDPSISVDIQDGVNFN